MKNLRICAKMCPGEWPILYRSLHPPKKPSFTPFHYYNVEKGKGTIAKNPRCPLVRPILVWRHQPRFRIILIAEDFCKEAMRLLSWGLCRQNHGCYSFSLSLSLILLSLSLYLSLCSLTLFFSLSILVHVRLWTIEDIYWNNLVSFYKIIKHTFKIYH